MATPISLPEPTICDMNCFFLPGHKGPHQFDAERRMYCTTCDDYGHNAFTHKEIEKNVKKTLSVYQGGPMANCSVEEMTGWRDQLKTDYPDINWLDPCRRSYKPQQWRQLVEEDLNDIVNADLLLCYYWKTGSGSAMELVMSRQYKVPNIVVVPEFKEVSPWVRYYSDFLVENFEHAMKIIQATWEGM